MYFTESIVNVRFYLIIQVIIEFLQFDPVKENITTKKNATILFEILIYISAKVLIHKGFGIVFLARIYFKKGCYNSYVIKKSLSFSTKIFMFLNVLDFDYISKPIRNRY